MKPMYIGKDLLILSYTASEILKIRIYVIWATINHFLNITQINTFLVIVNRFAYKLLNILLEFKNNIFSF